MTATWFLVCSAEYGTVVPVLDYGQGPIEFGRDCMYIRATTPERAKVLMVRATRRRTTRWNAPEWLRDGNPFRGMIAERENS